MKYVVTLNGKDYLVEVEQEEATLLSVSDTPVASVIPVAVATPDAGAATPVGAPASYVGDPIASPLPGMVLHIAAKPGAAYKQGDILVVIEAMKMENDVIAPRDCTVSSVFCKNGDTVQTGAVLLTIL
ncbi:MAG: acetyl-CoA carboxylase biotin carboxyl carrier protein subunit [Peptococcaceae bacterium]|jgi:biotin carboxyl carrier protein|nr:acetyl-CoA carboxylase biotin carboxyl carrier protein subunit [Peptococcaceae bacterium]